MSKVALMSPDDFGDFDQVSPSRLSERVAPTKPVADEDDSDYTPETKRPDKGWSDKPSIHQQALKMPDTVRTGPPITAVLNLSDPAELQTFNDIHAKVYDISGPLATINHIDKQFHAGQWHALITYSLISYQKL